MDSVALIGLVGAGIAWRRIARLPSAEVVRRSVSSLVFYVLLPALTFRSMLHAPLGDVLWKVPLAASVGIVVASAIALVVTRKQILPHRAAAAALAAGWGNVTYLGIPVLSAAFGNEATFVAVLYDFAASTPLLWTLGVALAVRNVHDRSQVESPWRRVSAVPPLWAAVAGILGNAIALEIPPLADRMLWLLGSAVVPLMMFVLGLSLRWEYLRRWRELVPVAALKLTLAPLVVLGVGIAIGLQGTILRAVLLEAAMPTMMLTLVVAERYRLDVEYIAAAIALTTVASAATLPLWWWLGSMLG
ncbi:MAG: AEC family transporter [Chlorobi bacterium]|nr:AEC family transporter [Chlorobiota bacterium]